MKNKIFVTGGRGAQGGNIAQLLISKGEKVTTLSRTDEDNSADLQVIKGGLEDVKSIQEALENADKAIFTLPLVFDNEQAKVYVSNFIQVAEDKGVSLVVFNAGFNIPSESTGLSAMDLKVEIKEMFDKSSLNVITLTPDIYIDNLAAPWSIPVMLEHNILPYPVAAGEKSPWISHFDLARYAVSAIEKPELSGQTLPIGGNLLEGEEIAAAISKEIGKQINFVSLTPNDFEAQLSPSFGEVAAKEISNLYRFVADKKQELLHQDFKTTQEKLGVEPQSLEDWVKSVNWTA